MIATIARSHGYFEGVGRLRLHYRLWEPPSPRAAILIVHGLAEHSGRYTEFGEVMAAHRFATCALDLRGHGRSDGRRGHIPRFEIFLQDLERFRREVLGLVDFDLPIFLLGHSMGGLITLRYLEEYEAPIRGAVVTCPWLATAFAIPHWKNTLACALSRVLPALPFASGLDANHLSHDPGVVSAYREDPLVHQIITPRLFTEASTAMGLVLQHSDRIRVPLLFLLAGADLITDTQRTVTFAQSLHGVETTVRIFPGHYHEVLNETDRETAFLEIRAWLKRRSSA